MYVSRLSFPALGFACGALFRLITPPRPPCGTTMKFLVGEKATADTSLLANKRANNPAAIPGRLRPEII